MTAPRNKKRIEVYLRPEMYDMIKNMAVEIGVSVNEVAKQMIVSNFIELWTKRTTWKPSDVQQKRGLSTTTDTSVSKN